MIAWGLPLVPFTTLVILLIDQCCPRSPEARYDRLRVDLQRDMDRRGLTQEGRRDERLIRYAIMDLRHKASEAVIRHPQRYVSIIDDLAAEEAKEIALISESASARFLKLVEDGRLELILHPDALAKVSDYLKRTMIVSRRKHRGTVASPWERHGSGQSQDGPHVAARGRR